MSPVPAGLIAERRVVNKLMLANAVSPETATQPGEMDGLRWIQARRLAKLVDAGVVREPQPGRYYLDIPALAERVNTRRQRGAVLMLILVMAMLVAMYFAQSTIRFR